MTEFQVTKFQVPAFQVPEFQVPVSLAAARVQPTMLSPTTMSEDLSPSPLSPCVLRHVPRPCSHDAVPASAVLVRLHHAAVTSPKCSYCCCRRHAALIVVDVVPVVLCFRKPTASNFTLTNPPFGIFFLPVNSKVSDLLPFWASSVYPA